MRVGICILGWLALVIRASPSQVLSRDNSKESLKRAIELHEQAKRLHSNGHIQEAIAKYREALRLEPDEAYWHAALGMALERSGDDKAALEEFRRAHQLSPLDSELLSKWETLSRALEAGGGIQIDPGKQDHPVQQLPSLPGRSAEAAKEVTPPIPTYKPEPKYSQKARKANLQGTVVLWVVVNREGTVTETRVIKPLGLGLDQKAIETVRKWKFKPASRNGTPTAVRVAIEIAFRRS